MAKQQTPIAVLGAGSWGTALAIQLCRAGGPVTLWGHDPEHIADINNVRCNQRYLPDITLPETLTLTADLAAALAGCAMC